MKFGQKILAFTLLLIGLAILLAGCTAGAPQDTPGITSTLQALKSDIQQDNAGVEASSQVAGKVDINCTETTPHPLGQSIADSYDVTYEQVMTWFCSGSTFDDILIALETSAAASASPDMLLVMRQQEKTWDQIWETTGFATQP